MDRMGPTAGVGEKAGCKRVPPRLTRKFHGYQYTSSSNMGCSETAFYSSHEGIRRSSRRSRLRKGLYADRGSSPWNHAYGPFAVQIFDGFWKCALGAELRAAHRVLDGESAQYRRELLERRARAGFGRFCR